MKTFETLTWLLACICTRSEKRVKHKQLNVSKSTFHKSDPVVGWGDGGGWGEVSPQRANTWETSPWSYLARWGAQCLPDHLRRMEVVGAAAWVSSVSPLARRGRMSRTDTKFDTPASSAHCTCLPLRMHGTDIRLLPSAPLAEAPLEEEEEEDDEEEEEEWGPGEEKEADFFTGLEDRLRSRFSEQDEHFLPLEPRALRTSSTSSSCSITRWNVSEASGKASEMRGLVRRMRLQSTSASGLASSPLTGSSSQRCTSSRDKAVAAEEAELEEELLTHGQLVSELASSRQRLSGESHVGAMTSSPWLAPAAVSSPARFLAAEGEAVWNADVTPALNNRDSLLIKPVSVFRQLQNGTETGSELSENRPTNDEVKKKIDRYKL